MVTTARRTIFVPVAVPLSAASTCTTLVLVRTGLPITRLMPMGDIPVNKLRWLMLLVMVLMYTGGVASQAGEYGMWLAWLFTIPAGFIWWEVTSHE